MKGSIQRRGHNWRVVVEAPPDPVTGVRRQVVRQINGKLPLRDAEALKARLLVEVGAGQHVGHDATLDELLDAWLAGAKLAVSTRRDYASARKLITEPMRRTPVWKIRARDLDALYLEVGRRVGPDRVRRVHNIIRRALAQAVKWGWVARNVAVDASPPAASRPDPRPPSIDEVRRLLAAADDELVTWLRVEAGLGARRGEVCALRWSDIDLVGGTATIRAALADGGPGVGLVVKETKTERSRTVALDTATTRVLREHRRLCAERALAVGSPMTGECWLFARDAEGMIPVRPDTISKRFADLRDGLSLGHVKLKDLRHFVITQLLAAGVDPRTVAGRAGHARTSTTLDIYAAFVPARDRDAADLLGRLIGE